MTRSILLVLVSVALFYSCHKPGNKLSKYIPKDAYVVFDFNTKSVMDKASKANISFDSLARALNDEKSDSSIQKAINKWNDIKNSGLDLDQPIYGFVKTGGSIMAGQSSTNGFVFALKDASAFEKYLKNEKPLGEIKKGENYSYLALGDDYIAGWNDDVVIIAQKHAGASSPGTYATGEGTLTQQMLTTLFAQKESESINNATGFPEMEKQNGDMAFFINSENQPVNPILGMTKLSDISKGSYVVGAANFDDGQITFSIKSHSGQAMTDLMKKYPYRPINTEMLDRYPSQIEAFLIASFNPKLISGLFKYLGVDALITSGLQQEGLSFSLDDIVNTFKGDIAVIGSDFGITTKTISSYGGYKLPQPVTTTIPQYKLLVNATVGDKASYDKVAGNLAQKGWMVQQNGQYIIPAMNTAGFEFKVTDKNLYIASTPELLQQYESGTSNKSNLPADISNEIKGKACAFYFNINQVLQVVPQPNSEEDRTVLEQSKATFKDILATFDVPGGAETSGKMVLRLMNDKENSLAAMTRYIVEVAKMEQNLKGKDIELSMPDSTAIPPPPPSK